MIEAVLFDFGQTLVDSADGFRGAEKQAQARIAAELGLTVEGEFLASYRRLRSQFQQGSDYSRASIWQAVYRQYGRQADPQVLQRWERDYWQQVANETALFPETMRVLGRLRAEYRLGLITNTQDQVWEEEHRLVRFPELRQLFGATVIAGESGVPPKPDPAPFRACLTQLGVEADRAVYVGDDWRNDVCGAKDAGLSPIWLKHHTVQRHWPDVETSAAVITSLEPLLDLDRLLRD